MSGTVSEADATPGAHYRRGVGAGEWQADPAQLAVLPAFDRLYAEGENSGTVMCVPLHAYQVSHPHRLAAFHDAMDYICSHDKVWKATGREIAQHYLDNHYDDALASMAAINAEDAA